MKSINHTQVRAWIEAATDGLLPASEQELLKAHLEGCTECSAYAFENQALETSLRHALQGKLGQPQLDPQAVNRLVQGIQNGLTSRGGSMKGTKKGENLMSNQGRLFGGLALLIGGFVFLIVVLGGGILTYQFLKYKNAGLDGLQTAPQAVVAITSPQTSDQASEGSALPVDVSSNGYQPLVSTELWVDGILMGVQAAPPGGFFNFNTTFLWSPGPAGEHSLVARALDANGDEAMSLPVVVNITAHVPGGGAEEDGAPFDAGPAGVLPAAFDGGGGGNAQPVNPPGQNESESPAQVGLPTVGDWVVNITNTEPPQAPDLTATMDGCIVTLHIHDLSENEEGFQVFRSILSAPAWTKIAALNSQSATEWITYADELPGSAKVSYYVAAVNGVGQAKSNPVPVNLTSAGCPAPEGDQEILIIKPVSFHIDAAVDQAYCYKSLGGVHWDRWPADGFFLPGADGFNIQPYQMTFAVNGLDGEPLIEKLDLYVECWGWAGGELTSLGEVHFGSADLSDLGEQGQDSGIFTMALESDIDIYDPSPQYDIIVPPPESAEMPFTDALLTYDPQVCKDHLPGEFQNLFGVLMYCFPFPDYTQGPGTADPQPYLVWNVRKKNACPALNTECHTVESLMEIAELNGGNVFFSVYDNNDYIEKYTFVEAPFTAHVVTPSKCVGTRKYTVKIIYTDPENYVEGFYGNLASIPCPIQPPPLTQAHLDVTFDTLTLSNVDDNDPGLETVELYGTFKALSTDGSQGTLQLVRWPPFDDYCDSQPLDQLIGPDCPHGWSDGTYSLKDQSLCATTAGGCIQQSGFKNGNNVVHITVGDGDQIVLQVWLTDWDDSSGVDTVCFATIATSGNTALGWAGETVNFGLSQGDNGNAACNVQGTISATP